MILLPLFLGYWAYRLEILGLDLAFFFSERVSQSAVQAKLELTIDLTSLELAIFWLCLVSAGNTSKLHHLQPCLPEQMLYFVFLANWSTVFLNPQEGGNQTVWLHCPLVVVRPFL